MLPRKLNVEKRFHVRLLKKKSAPRSICKGMHMKEISWDAAAFESLCPESYFRRDLSPAGAVHAHILFTLRILDCETARELLIARRTWPEPKCINKDRSGAIFSQARFSQGRWSEGEIREYTLYQFRHQSAINLLEEQS